MQETVMPAGTPKPEGVRAAPRDWSGLAEKVAKTAETGEWVHLERISRKEMERVRDAMSQAMRRRGLKLRTRMVNYVELLLWAVREE